MISRRIGDISAAIALTVTLVVPVAAAAQQMAAAPAEPHDMAPMNPYISTVSYPVAKDTLMTNRAATPSPSLRIRRTITLK